MTQTKVSARFQLSELDLTTEIIGGNIHLDEMKVWMSRAVKASPALGELRGLLVPATFYAGWPVRLAADRAALEPLEADGRRQPDSTKHGYKLTKARNK
ncbi:hypothetical protein [Ramlibacter sp. 2FC]|uniref:hypothetical protein n=1 Tax=Ramlibacter sp. 2FC TaxID=2502188 RepID=UPI0010F7278E|nr:hypothetical protein [Ramlibacter sp. 2FC]